MTLIGTDGTMTQDLEDYEVAIFLFITFGQAWRKQFDALKADSTTVLAIADGMQVAATSDTAAATVASAAATAAQKAEQDSPFAIRPAPAQAPLPAPELTAAGLS